MNLKLLALAPLRQILAYRIFPSALLAHMAWWILEHYENINPNPDTNGETRLLCQLTQTDPLVVFDVGANVGEWAAAARSYFPKAQIYVFEPSPLLAPDLSRRSKELGLTFHPLALSDRCGTAPFRIDRDQTELSSLVLAAGEDSANSQIIDVPISTIDNFLETQSIKHIDLLKIDAEGHDLSVLRGATLALKQNRIRAIQFEHNEKSIFSHTFLRDYYDLLSSTHAIGRILPTGCLFSSYTTRLELIRYGNYICIPRDATKLIHDLEKFA